jgi:hypothetical protein
MKAVTALSGVLLLIGILSVVPSAQAMNDPFGPPCPSMGGCCGIEPAEGGCCAPSCGIPPPACPEVGTTSPMWTTVVPVPSVQAATHRDCTATVTESSACPAGTVPSQFGYRAGPVTVGATVCAPMCACMPMSAPAVAPCACPQPACAAFTVVTFEATIAWSNSCAATVDSHDNLVNCVVQWTGPDPSAGRVTVVTDPCQPICACMPASTGAFDARAIVHEVLA